MTSTHQTQLTDYKQEHQELAEQIWSIITDFCDQDIQSEEERVIIDKLLAICPYEGISI